MARAAKAVVQVPDKKQQEAQARERRRLLSDAIERNRSMPRLVGRFSQLSIGIFGESEKPRWAVLDPRTATLSLSCERPHDAQETLEGSPRSTPSSLLGSIGYRTSKAPRQVYQLSKIEEVDANTVFRNIFLSIGGETKTLVLTAERDDDFKEWMRVLNMYVVEPEDAIATSAGPIGGRSLAAAEREEISPVRARPGGA